MLKSLRKSAALWALISILYLLGYDWIYSTLFFDVRPVWLTIFDLLLPMLLVIAVYILGRVLIGSDCVFTICDAISSVGLVFFFYGFLKNQGILGFGIPLMSKAFVAFVVCAAIISVFYKASAELKSRFRIAIIFCAVTFIISPQLIGQLGWLPNAYLSPSFHTYASEPEKANVVLLILDEWDHSVVTPIINSLDRGGRVVYAKGVNSSGNNTIDAIPALLTGKKFISARVCTSSAVCETSTVFDFSKQRVMVSNFNLIGAYHPYCKIEGLAYCKNFGLAFDVDIVRFACNILKQYSFGYQSEYCERSWFRETNFQASRENVAAAVEEAPFWDTGGVLFIHTLLPHPPGSTIVGNLSQEYSDNVADAAKLAGMLLARLEKNFGDNFLLVITSDHPLRPTVWCKTFKYSREGCESVLASKQVPLVVVGNGAASLMSLTSNLELIERIFITH